MADAAKQAAAFIETYVRSTFRAEASSDSTSDSTEEVVVARVNARLRALRPVDEYSVRSERSYGSYVETRWEVYVLARLPETAVEGEWRRLRDEGQGRLREALRLLASADAAQAGGRHREERVLLWQSLASVRGIPDGTRGGEGDGQSAGELRRSVQGRLRERDAAARRGRAEAEIVAAGVATGLGRSVEGALEVALEKEGVLVRRGGDARFAVALRGQVRPGGAVFGQQVVVLAFTGVLRDAWVDEGGVAVLSGEVKGFGRSVGLAALDAANRAAVTLATAAARKVRQIVDGEVREEMEVDDD